MKKNKGQILITVFLLLLIVSVLAGALSIMWISEVKTSKAQNDALVSFYLANAGIEEGKLLVQNDVTSEDLDGSDWITTAQGRYKFYIDNELTTTELKNMGVTYAIEYEAAPKVAAIGQALDASGNIIAERRMQVHIDDLYGIECSSICTTNKQDLEMTLLSWEELVASDTTDIIPEPP